MIDRTAPAVRPQGRASGYQLWRSLLFLHWPVPLEKLRPLVPEPLSVDTFDGVAYVGVVPFAMRGVRPRWLCPCLALKFLETNVRTYVHLDGRPGVYFFSLDAASRLAVLGARWGWSLPYFHARMTIKQDGDQIAYETRRSGSGASLRVRYRVGEALGPAQPGGLEHFLVERYLLFLQRRGAIRVGQVHHSPYLLQSAHVLEMKDELVAAAGLPPVEQVPELAHYVAGVDVEVFGLRKT